VTPNQMKVCIYCAEDCSSRPRTKDAQGRYACRSCHEAALAKARPAAAVATAAPEDGPIPIEDDLLMGLADGAPVAVASSACPGCGHPLHGAVVCIRCGFNTSTGKAASIKVQKPGKARTPKEDKEGATGAILANGALVATICLGAFIGGLAAAGAWGFTAYHLGHGFRYFGIIIGGIVGAGAYMGARGYAGALSGGIACVAVIGAVIGGRYFAVSMLLEKMEPKIRAAARNVSDEEATSYLGRDVADELNARGVHYQWPEGVDDPTLAMGEEEFPAPVWTEAQKRWAAMSETEQHDFKIAQGDKRARSLDQGLSSFKREVATDVGPMDYVYGLIAMCVAFFVGSGASFD
jgi:hypothetical protein